MKPYEIRAALVGMQVKNVDIAAAVGVSFQLVSNIIHRRGTSPRVRRYIAKILGESYEAVWEEPDPTSNRSNDSTSDTEVTK